MTSRHTEELCLQTSNVYCISKTSLKISLWF